MTKKNKLLLIFAVIIFLLLNSIVIITSINNKNSKRKDTDNITKKQTQIVNNTINSISDKNLKDDVTKNIDKQDFYNNLKKIHNYKYSNEFSNFLVKANDELNKKDSSFINEYKNGTSIEDILYSTCGNDFGEFVRAYLIGDDNNKEYSDKDIENLYFELLKNNANYEYEKTINTIDELLKTYKFTNKDNQKIANVYHDAQFMKNKENLDTSVILENMYDPVDYLIYIFSMDNASIDNNLSNENTKFLHGKINLSNVNTKKISLSSSDYKDEFKTVFDYYSSFADDVNYYLYISKIDFEIDSKSYTAYIATDVDHVCKLYGWK